MSKRDLLSAIQADKDANTHLLQSFLQARSPNPPGDTVSSARMITNFLSHHSVPFSIISPLNDAPNGVSTFESSDSTRAPVLVMNGHLDVFPVSDAKDWRHDPWGGEIDDGRIYGRGVVDMKAGTAALVIAYVYLYQFRTHLPRGTCVLEAVSDEENGGLWGSKYLLDEDDRRELWMGDVVLNAEPSGLNSIRFGEKGSLRLTFTIKTQGGHGAFIHLDEGSIRVATRLIQRLVSAIEGFQAFTLDPEIAKHLAEPEVRRVIDEIMGPGAADHIVRPTVNVGTISAGSKVNVIPNTCVFETDIRLPIGLTQEPILNLIDNILRDFPQTSYKIQAAASNPPNASSPNHPLADFIARNGEAVLGRKPVVIPSMGGTDVKHWRYRGVPGYSFGVSPEGMAGVDESVSLEDFHNLIKVLAGAAWDFLGGAA